jgi:polysaccharide export outer membrane protein
VQFTCRAAVPALGSERIDRDSLSTTNRIAQPAADAIEQCASIGPLRRIECRRLDLPRRRPVVPPIELMQARTVVLLALLLVTSIASGQQPDTAGRAAAAAATYRVGPEDVLEISVWKDDALKKEVLVRPDGGMSYPLIGEVQAAGKTLVEIRDEITKRLDRFLAEPVVSVAVVKIGSQRIYVLGKVGKPGPYPVGQYVDVLQALSMAGGLAQFAAANEIRIIRRQADRQVVLPFEYERVIRGQNLDQNIVLRTGDVVVVP